MHQHILITGVSGSGKTTVARTLNEQGRYALDMDDHFGAMYFKDTKKMVETEYENHDLAWVQNVEWICDVQRIRKALQQPGQIFCLGFCDNILELLPLFDCVLLLRLGEDALRHRLTTRTDNNWGQTPNIQDWLMEQKAHYEKLLLENGAIPINANTKLTDVVSDILRVADSE